MFNSVYFNLYLPCSQSQTSNHNYQQGLKVQVIMAAPVFTKVESMYKAPALPLSIIWISIDGTNCRACLFSPEPAGAHCIRRPAGGARVPCEGGALTQSGLVQRRKTHRGLS